MEAFTQGAWEGDQGSDFMAQGLRSKMAILALAAAGLAGLGSLLASLAKVLVLRRLREGVTVDQDLANLTELAVGCFAILELGVLLACAVLFCVWFHRAYKNLDALRVASQAHSPAQAVWSFFIPILNVYLPYRVALEIWRESDPEVVSAEAVWDPPEVRSSLPSIWWGLFILGNVIGNGGALVLSSATHLAAMLRATQILLIAEAFGVAAAVAAIFLILRLDQRQVARFQAIRALAAPAMAAPSAASAELPLGANPE